MARLSNFHILCPLIDQNNFLGVVSDSTNDCVVVTLGRNIVIRYKVTDRKQVGSWSTREKLTSPVVFDSIGRKYVAVFNHKHIRIWNQEDEDLDAVTKHKLPEPVHTLLVDAGAASEPAILFQSGRAWKLSYYINDMEKFMELRDKQGRSGVNSIMRGDENLEKWHLISCQSSSYIILMARATSRPKNPTFYLMKLINEDDDVYNLQRRFTLHIKESCLVGHTVIEQNGCCSLLTLWSNGNIYQLNLDCYAMDDASSFGASEHPSASETISPGSFVDSVKELFDLENSVAMTALGPHHIALYGADSSHEGAVVYVVDIHSSVTGELPWEALKESAAKQCLERCNVKETPPRVWNAAGHLFIPSSDGRLVLASFELGTLTPLANLIGCLGKKTSSIKSNGMLGHSDQLLYGSWFSIHKSTQLSGEQKSEGTRKFNWDYGIPLKVLSKLRPLIEMGLPESRICGVIFPELMNEADEDSISWCISHFSDIPEEDLVNLLCFFLSRDVSTSPKMIHLKKVAPFSGNPPQEDSSNGVRTKAISRSMMNGDLSILKDVTSGGSQLEENDALDTGFVFVKGRRRSVRAMGYGTPQREVVPSKDITRKTVYSQEPVDMEAEAMASPKLKSTGNKNNLSMALNRLDDVKEGENVSECDHRASGNMEVEASVDSSGVLPEISGSFCRKPKGNGFVDKRCRFEEGIFGIALSDRHRKQIDKLLSIPVSSFILLPALRSKLPFHLALKLIKHLLQTMTSSEVNDGPSDGKVVDWICHLLDAFCQQCTLSQDDNVLGTLQAVKKVLDSQIQSIEVLKEMEALLLLLKSGRIVREHKIDKWYSIENIRLY